MYPYYIIWTIIILLIHRYVSFFVHNIFTAFYYIFQWLQVGDIQWRHNSEDLGLF